MVHLVLALALFADRTTSGSTCMSACGRMRLGVVLAAPDDELAPGSGQHQVDLLVD
jgi:hypothetical protein